MIDFLLSVGLCFSNVHIKAMVCNVFQDYTQRLQLIRALFELVMAQTDPLEKCQIEWVVQQYEPNFLRNTLSFGERSCGGQVVQGAMQ